MLNNYLERDLDARMVRTRDRALPAGLIEPHRALTLGVGLVLFGGTPARMEGKYFDGLPGTDGRIYFMFWFIPR